MERRIPCVLMRGGTSRGAFLLETDLPADTAARDRVLLRIMGSPDPLRLRYRESLTDAMGLVVRERRSLQAALDELGLGEASAPGFRELLMDELKKLEVFNCARYRLTLSATQAWIAASRPL